MPLGCGGQFPPLQAPSAGEAPALKYCALIVALFFKLSMPWPWCPILMLFSTFHVVFDRLIVPCALSSKPA